MAALSIQSTQEALFVQSIQRERHFYFRIRVNYYLLTISLGGTIFCLAASIFARSVTYKQEFMRRPSAQPALQGSLKQLEPHNLGREVADSIRSLILNGQLQPGGHIVEADLAKTLGVSNGTVRAGLQQLRHEGLVEYKPNHGVFVRRLSSRDAWEVYTLRNTLEAMAAGMAARHVTDEARQKIRAVLEQMRKAVEAGDRLAAIHSDFEFHRLVVRLSGHRLLKEYYRLVELQTQLFMVLTDSFHPDLSHMIPLHEPLAAAIIAGDGERAVALAADLNTADGERLVEHLTQMEAEV
ncbi:MAG: GntR family transcriptional regulator [Candidatus Methylomirabilales bacterium]